MNENRQSLERTTHKYLDIFEFTWDDLKGKKILDVGSGSSKFAEEAKKKRH